MWEGTVFCKEFFNFVKLFGIREASEQKKIYNFFKAKSVIMYKALYNIFYINSPVIEFTVTRNSFSVFG